MKTITIIRHAKSDWSMEGQSDIDRSLNERGYSDAHNIGKLLKQKVLIPQVMISSPAIRALSTALIISDEISFPKKNIRIEPDLYETGISEYLKVLKAIDKDIDSIAIFGHNPVISDLSSYLSGKAIEMPTCSVVRFCLLSGTWNSLSPNQIEYIEMFSPKTIILT